MTRALASLLRRIAERFDPQLQRFLQERAELHEQCDILLDDVRTYLGGHDA